MGELKFLATGRRRRSHNRRHDQVVAGSIIAALVVMLGSLSRPGAGPELGANSQVAADAGAAAGAGVVASADVVAGADAGADALPVPVARVVAEPGALSFPETLLNTDDAPTKAVTLKLEGVAGSALAPSFTGADTSSFRLSNGCGPTLAGSSCRIAITFRPRKAGPLSATLQIRDKAKLLAKVEVSGSGRKADEPSPAITILPNPVSLRSQEVGEGNGGYPVRITNIGKVSIVVTFQAGPGSSEIQLQGVCAGKTLEPQQYCVEKVDFTPPRKGSFQRQFSLVANDKALGTLYVTGSGVEAGVEIDPGVLTFEAEREKKITISNRGDVPLRITRVVMDGNGREFRASADACIAAHVAVGGACQISVAVLQPFRDQAQQASLSVTDNAPGSPHTIELQANQYSAQLIADPMALNYGRNALGVSRDLRTVISNRGNAPSGPLSLSAGGGFAIVESQCQQLDPGESCDVAVRFTPASAQDYTGSLTVRYPNGRRPLGVILTGVGHREPENPAGVPPRDNQPQL